MSHVVMIKSEIRDATAVAATCQRLGLQPPREGTARLFSSEASGLLVELEGWRFPVVCSLATGQIRFDNYRGNWGAQAKLDQFLQMYAVEKTRIEARKRGHSVLEQALPDGSIKLTVQLAGSA